MSRIQLLNLDKLIIIMIRIGFLITFVYFISMFVYPWFDGNTNWKYVQNVWERWQGLNVGMLAFFSSITAFSISRFNAKEQRRRNFSAEKAFLPHSLSELCDYFDSCASLLQEAWNTTEEKLDTDKLKLPESYKDIFRNCIRYAEYDVGNYLSKILVKLQINHARLTSLNDNKGTLSKANIISYIYSLGELQIMINKLFGFARSTEEFNSSPPKWQDFRNSFSNWFKSFEDFTFNNVSLEEYTKLFLEQKDYGSKTKN